MLPVDALLCFYIAALVFQNWFQPPRGTEHVRRVRHYTVEEEAYRCTFLGEVGGATFPCCFVSTNILGSFTYIALVSVLNTIFFLFATYMITGTRLITTKLKYPRKTSPILG